MKVSLKTGRWAVNFFSEDCSLKDFKILFECENISCGDVIERDGKTYSVCATNNKIGLAMVEQVSIKEAPKEITCDDELECPVCGKTAQDSWELPNGDENYTCENCGSILEYDSFFTRTFTVKVKKSCEIKKV